jgi:hypothetical protein
MTNENSLNELEQLLLMAAAVHELTPKSHFAITAKVVRQVLRWTGSFSEEVIEAWNSDDDHSTIDLVYGTLVRMTQPINSNGPIRPPEREGEVLFEGQGNWGNPRNPDNPPAYPHFNACRLTIHGWNLANNLLMEHPEYRKTEV